MILVKKTSDQTRQNVCMYVYLLNCTEPRNPALSSDVCMYGPSHIARVWMAGRPGSSEVPRNPLTRWDVSSIPANGIFLTKKLKKLKKNAQRAEND